MKETIVKIQFDDNKSDPIDAEYVRDCFNDCCVDYINVLDVLPDGDNKHISVDELLVSNNNLHEAVSILIRGISSGKSSYEILSSWDSFRRNDESK